MNVSIISIIKSILLFVKVFTVTSQTLREAFHNFDGEVLDSCKSVSEDDSRHIIHSSPTKSCAHDHVPTRLLKKYGGESIPVMPLGILQNMVNPSLAPTQPEGSELPTFSYGGEGISRVLKQYRFFSKWIYFPNTVK